MLARSGFSGVDPHLTNGLVERLQATIPQEHWRVEFRGRYFTRAKQLEVSFQSDLRLYDHERVHRCYRTRGRP